MYEAAEVSIRTGSDTERTFSYRLMRPDPDLDAAPYPLVVFLHGAGERGSDNQRQLKYLPEWMASERNRADHPCFLIALQCPEGESWAPFDRSNDMAPVPGPPQDPLLAVVRAIDLLADSEPIDRTRIYLTGLSMGGYGAWRLASLHPDRFAAVVPICGGGDPVEADALTGMQIWAVHGTEDSVVPERLSRVMVEAVRDAGGIVRYSPLEGVPHDSWTPAYRHLGVIQWMFRKRLAPEAEGPVPVELDEPEPEA